MKNFDEVISTLAQEKFGIPYLRPFQRLVISRILEQKDVPDQPEKNQLIVLPTGSGKSICFQLPALILQGLTIIVYPLLSLMNDQRQSLDRNSIASVMLKGGQTNGQRRRIWSELKAGNTRIVITNPETLVSEHVLKRLAEFSIDLFVVDEAHTVCEWGESFRPAYLRLSQMTDRLKPRQLIAFTATASQDIMRRLEQLLFNGKTPHLIVASPDRPNIRYHLRRSICMEHDIIMLLTHGAARPAIIFCRTRLECEDLAWQIRENCRTIPVQYYHAGLDKREREAIEKWFLLSMEGVLCATTAYGMGVSKNNTRTVVHKGLPDNAQSYLQESGRAGRDGRMADAWVLIDDFSKTGASSSEGMMLAFSGKTCIRENLLRLMDVELESDFCCSGCDVCDGRIQTMPEGRMELESVIRRFPLRFRIEELAWLISGTRIQPTVQRWDWLDPIYGLLDNWTQPHLCLALENLCGTKTVGRVLRGPFKNRLYAPFTHKGRQSSGTARSYSDKDDAGITQDLKFRRTDQA